VQEQEMSSLQNTWKTSE